MPMRSKNLVSPISILVGQGLTVLAVGAGGVCSDIFFLSPITSFFFLLLSGLNRWTTCGFKSFSTEF